MIPELKSTQKTKQTADLRNVKFIYNDYTAQADVFVSRVRAQGSTDGQQWKCAHDSTGAGANEAAADTVEYMLDFETVRDLQAGAYILSVSSKNATVTVSDSEGAANALTTFYKLIRNGSGLVEEQTINDSPDYPHRGFQIDIARHFLDRGDIEDIIDKMSLLKLNRCHLYFSDDWGYRLESKAFPELNEIASWYINEDGSKTGGFLSMDDVRHITAFANARGIEIIPEIDMPGHVTEFLAAYPQLGCFGDKVKVWNEAGISKDVLCVSKESTYEFIFKLLDEVTELFPYEYFHIGGDEVPTDNWEKCESCQAFMKEKGMKSEGELQFHFMNRVIDYLTAKGKKIICWNDILKSGKFPENAMVHYWCEPGFEVNPENIRPDQKFIYSFCRAFYYDFRDATVTLENTYSWPTKFVNGEEIPKENIAGFECENWAEFTYTKDERLAKMFPRVYALSERCWNGTRDIRHLQELIKDEEQYGTYAIDGLTYATWLE